MLPTTIRVGGNFSWKNNQQGPQLELVRPPLGKKVSFEEAMAQLARTQNQFMNETRTSLQNYYVQLRSLEKQMSQMTSMIAERQKGNRPSNLEVNPRREGKKQYKAITLKNCKSLEILAEVEETEKEERKVKNPPCEGIESKQRGNEVARPPKKQAPVVPFP